MPLDALLSSQATRLLKQPNKHSHYKEGNLVNPASYRNGRGDVETDKLHAMIHYIVCRVEVLVKTPLVHGSKDAVFTQIDTAPLPLRHNSCEDCTVLIVTGTTSARRY